MAYETNPSYIVVGPRLEDTAENRATATACLGRAASGMIRDLGADMGTNTYFQQIPFPTKTRSFTRFPDLLILVFRVSRIHQA